MADGLDYLAEQYEKRAAWLRKVFKLFPRAREDDGVVYDTDDCGPFPAANGVTHGSDVVVVLQVGGEPALHRAIEIDGRAVVACSGVRLERFLEYLRKHDAEFLQELALRVRRLS